MNSRERVLTALQLGEPDRVPWFEHSVALPIQAAIMGCEPEEVDRFEFAERMGLDALSVMGLQPTASAAGRTSTGDRRYGGGALQSKSDWETWVETWPDPKSDALYEPLDQFIDRRCRNDSNIAIFYVSALGIDLLMNSWGIERYSLLLADDLPFVRHMMDRHTEWNIVFHEQLCQRDIDFVYACHDLAGTQGTFFSPRFLRQEVFPREREVAKHITIPWIYHCCGDFSTVAQDIIDHGCNGIDPFQPEAIDIVSFKEMYGDQVCVKGNVCMDTLMLRDPGVVEKKVREKIAKLAPGGGYIISSAHSIYGACKAENVVRRSVAIRKYGKYPVAV